MSNYREIVTKTIVGKGRKAFSSKHLYFKLKLKPL